MASYCYLIFGEDRTLICTVNHRKKGVCDLDKKEKQSDRIRRPRHGKRSIHGRVPTHNGETAPTQIGGGKTDGSRGSFCIAPSDKLPRTDGDTTS